MLLAIDIGNTSIKFGVYEGERLITKFSIPTKRDYTADEIGKAVNDRLPDAIKAAIAVSVVPKIESEVAAFVSHSAGIEPLFVRNDFDFRLKINYEPLSAAGTDRLVNSFAAAEKYGVPVIVVSLGTATTIDVINATREHLGGLIAPGMQTTAKALQLFTSKLPEIEIRKPECVIAHTTETSIQSGIVYGHIAMIQGLLERIASEIGDRPGVVATGGYAELLASETKAIDIVDPDLTLEGLRILYSRISGGRPSS